MGILFTTYSPCDHTGSLEARLQEQQLLIRFYVLSTELVRFTAEIKALTDIIMTSLLQNYHQYLYSVMSCNSSYGRPSSFRTQLSSL